MKCLSVLVHVSDLPFHLNEVVCVCLRCSEIQLNILKLLKIPLFSLSCCFFIQFYSGFYFIYNIASSFFVAALLTYENYTVLKLYV